MLCHQYIATAATVATVAARVWSARLVDARSTRSCSCSSRSSRSSSDGGTLPCREREALERVREAVLRKELPRAQPLEPVRVAAGKQGVLAAQTRQHWARRPLLRPTNATRVLCHAVVAALFTQKHTRAKKRKRGREREREKKETNKCKNARTSKRAAVCTCGVLHGKCHGGGGWALPTALAISSHHSIVRCVFVFCMVHLQCDGNNHINSRGIVQEHQQQKKVQKTHTSTAFLTSVMPLQAAGHSLPQGRRRPRHLHPRPHHHRQT